ncbi:hypothetical protein Amal_03643 [Acetobacter malorum]|uniref:Uncharacterized protein n=1 Tax=Acetobacter malorum TaxID=178901 RepID=A0A177G5Y2_9PROT|nr:hypothetical protein Amal_03643 [Acetobacter malorum]
MFTNSNGFVFLATGRECWQWTDLGVVVTGIEQRERIAFFFYASYAVRGGDECSGGHNLQHIANIDNKGSWNRGGINPFSVAVHNFQTRLVCKQDGKTFIVSMSPNTRSILCFGIIRIMNHTQF